LDFKLLDDNGKVNQGEIIFTLFGLFAESEVKKKLERFVRKRKELMVMGLSIGGKLLFGYDRSKLENKRIHLWLMMNKQPLEQYLTGILTV
jgi:DNA invertase Pin-like site-specific DNA recombinase